MATDFPLYVFFFPPPELISASYTGLLVNNILPIKKNKIELYFIFYYINNLYKLIQSTCYDKHDKCL